LNKAGHASAKVDLTVLRPGQPEPVKIPDLPPIRLSPDDYGLGIGRPYQEEQAVVAAAVHGSAAEAAGVPRGARVVSVAGESVTTWDDVFRVMRAAAARSSATRPATQSASASGTGDEASPVVIPVTLLDESGQERKVDLKLSSEQVAGLMRNRYGHPLTGLAGTIRPRKASGFLDAVKQGAVETRDFILQFYVTLRRIVTGDVSYKNVTGPVGIFQAGAGFAARGNDWLLWFLSMISANLAVVNFLPIPIVDGGLFLFLLLEKIKGRPLSAKTQAIAQYVGLAMLLGIVLFVTWQDIIWLPFRGR
jgi:regulator of sigma E protease